MHAIIKNAAEFFQSYIDMSLHRLPSEDGSSSRGIERLATSATVDLASAYNLLGLALRESGSDLTATKNAFLAGLSVAPDNIALLINGGVAHQVCHADPHGEVDTCHLSRSGVVSPCTVYVIFFTFCRG